MRDNIINLSDLLYYTRVYVYHYSQTRAANAIGISLAYYSDLELGKVKRKRTSFDIIERIGQWSGYEPEEVNLLKKGRRKTIE